MASNTIKTALGVASVVLAIVLGLRFVLDLMIAQAGIVSVPTHHQSPTEPLDDLTCPPFFLNAGESAVVAASVRNSSDQDLTYQVNVYLADFSSQTWNKLHSTTVAVAAQQSVEVSHTLSSESLPYDQKQFVIIVEALSSVDLAEMRALPPVTLYEWKSSYFGKCPVAVVGLPSLTGRESFVVYSALIALGVVAGARLWICGRPSTNGGE
ncbi:MAG: hypothetical protein SXV54_02980 [Chloroflexota bacterium]|nr:hypothetical protein [Chloroflexota bacterium]